MAVIPRRDKISNEFECAWLPMNKNGVNSEGSENSSSPGESKLTSWEKLRNGSRSEDCKFNCKHDFLLGILLALDLKVFVVDSRRWFKSDDSNGQVQFEKLRVSILSRVRQSTDWVTTKPLSCLSSDNSLTFSLIAETVVFELSHKDGNCFLNSEKPPVKLIKNHKIFEETPQQTKIIPWRK